MTTAYWKIGVSGDWENNGNWNGGEPNSTTDVTISAFGSYEVDLNSSAFASSLTINASGAKFDQTSASGPLAITNALTLTSGRAIFRAANTIGSVTQTGGLMELSGTGNLGAGTYTFSGGELLAFHDATFTNALTMSANVNFSAETGTTLTENSSSWSYDATSGGTISFGASGDAGTVLWGTYSASINHAGNYTVEIAAGTFKGADTHWSFLFSYAGTSRIDSGATLDMNGIGGQLSNLQGAGSIINGSGSTTALTVLTGGNFSGAISGNIQAELNDGTLVLSGNNTYTGGTTIDSGATLQLGAGGTKGAVTGAISDAGTLIYDHSNALTITNSITGAGAVTYEGGGGVTINLAEGYTGATTVINEKATTNNGGAFGTGVLTLQDSALVVTATQTLAATQTIFEGNSTISAAHGTTVTGSAAWSLHPDGQGHNGALNINDSSNDGTVVWMTGGASITPPTSSVEVHAGTLRAGDSYFDFLLYNAQAGVKIDAGATIDTGQWGGGVSGLSGSGTLTGSADAAIDLYGGNFAGVISGAVSLTVIDGVVLSGANTYTQGTTIDANSVLMLGSGGTTGSVIGDIVDNGTLTIDHSNTVTIGYDISGAGGFTQYGSGTTIIDRAEDFTGEVDVEKGILSIDRGTAVGTGAMHIEGGELLTTASTTLANQIVFDGHATDTIAAATGTTLNFSSPSGWYINAAAPLTIDFGDGTNNGTVVWKTPVFSAIAGAGNYAVDVVSGTFQAGDTSASFMLDHSNKVTIGATATLDIAGFEVQASNVVGTGHIANSGAAAVFSFQGGDFGGTIDTNVQVAIYDTTTFDGASYSGTMDVTSGAAVTFDNMTSASASFDATGTLNVNNAAGVSSNILVDAAGGDIINGGAGDETFSMGSTLAANDSVNGGTGNDFVILSGDYSGGLTLGASTLVNVENLLLVAGNDYAITSNEATVAAGKTLTVDASSLGSGNALAFNGVAETDGSFILKGGAGNDSLIGGAMNDKIYAGLGITDVMHGGDGDDLISTTGGTLTATDQIDGGAGHDEVYLNDKSYTGANALVFSATTMVNVELLKMANGHSYDITTNDATVAAGQTLTVDASALTSSHHLTFDGSAETNGNFSITGSDGADTITTGSGNDVVDGGGSSDVIHTGAGNDTIDGGSNADKIYAGTGTDVIDGGTNNDLISFTGGQLTAADKIDGGTGTDEVYLNSNYTGANAVVFSATTMVNVELLRMANGNSYDITTNDATVAAGKTLTVDASALTSSHHLTFDGSAETNGNFSITGSDGADTITTGSGNDVVDGGGSSDVIHTGAGNDTIDGGSNADKIYAGTGTDVIDGGTNNDLISFTGGQLTAADKIDGGTGTDEVYLNSNYTGANQVIMNSTTMVNVELIRMANGNSYHLTTASATVASGATLTVDASALSSSHVLIFDGSAETNGHFVFQPGDGSDTLTGGSQSDTFDYATAAQSTSTHYDTINAFNFASDKFDVTGTISKIDTGVSHAISTASFDTDIAAAASASHLAAGSAMLVTATSGTLSGDVFLVIDQNGTAGYQAGHDLVINLHAATGTLATSDFI